MDRTKFKHRASIAAARVSSAKFSLAEPWCSQCDKQIIQIRADKAICNIRPVSANIWSVSVLSSSRSASVFADFICSDGVKSIRMQRIQILDGYSHKLFNNFITTTAIQLLLRPILFFHRCTGKLWGEDEVGVVDCDFAGSATNELPSLFTTTWTSSPLSEV